MRTLQIFRTKSKDYQQAFHKMENFIKEQNLSVKDYAESNGDKDILKELALLINIHEPKIEKYKELIDTPFEGDTIEHFSKYLFNKIIKISGNYHSLLDELVEEVYRDVNKGLYPIAKYSLQAHLIKLINDGRVEQIRNEFLWRC